MAQYTIQVRRGRARYFVCSNGEMIHAKHIGTGSAYEAASYCSLEDATAAVIDINFALDGDPKHRRDVVSIERVMPESDLRAGEYYNVWIGGKLCTGQLLGKGQGIYTLWIHELNTARGLNDRVLFVGYAKEPPHKMEFVLEFFRPPFGGQLARLHEGSFENVRESFSPCMVRTETLLAYTSAQAYKRARTIVYNTDYAFIGFAEDAA